MSVQTHPPYADPPTGSPSAVHPCRVCRCCGRCACEALPYALIEAEAEAKIGRLSPSDLAKARRRYGSLCSYCAEHEYRRARVAEGLANARRALAAFYAAVPTATAVISSAGTAHDPACGAVKAHLTYARQLIDDDRSCTHDGMSGWFGWTWPRLWAIATTPTVVARDCKSCSPKATVQGPTRRGPA